MFFHHYSVPDFFEIDNHEDILIKRELKTEEEWEKFLTEFYEYFVTQKNSHLSNHLLFTMGDDFLYFKRAEENYKLIEEIMERFNKKYPQVHMFFSTPSRYINSIEK